MENKELMDLKLWYAKYLANFNGGLDYWKLPVYRRETYLTMAQEMLDQAILVIQKAERERVLKMVRKWLENWRGRTNLSLGTITYVIPMPELERLEQALNQLAGGK